MGSNIVDMANDNNLVLLNTGLPTCFKYSPPSVTDLTFVSSDMAVYSMWEPLNDLSGSDHLPILIQVGNTA